MASQVGVNREAVITAAAALAEQHGFANVTLAMLAAQLGIRSQSLYAHVDGIEGLRRELALRGQQVLADELRTAIMARTGRDAVRAWARAFAGFAADHAGLYEASVRVPGDDGELAQASGRAMEPLLTLLATYGLEGDEAVHEYRIIWSTLHGFVSLRRAGMFTLAADPDETLDRLVGQLADDLELRRRSR